LNARKRWLVPNPPNDEVIDALQTVVSLHLKAIETYQSQSSHFERWGYSILAEEFAGYVEEERAHLKWAMDRVEFYKVVPTTEHPGPEDWPPNDFLGILASNYKLEQAAADAERAAIATCRDAGDEVSAIGLVPLLSDSENALKEIEATNLVIEQIGLDNFLSVKVKN